MAGRREVSFLQGCGPQEATCDPLNGLMTIHILAVLSRLKVLFVEREKKEREREGRRERRHVIAVLLCYISQEGFKRLESSCLIFPFWDDRLHTNLLTRNNSFL